MLSAYSTPTPYRHSACLSDRSCLQFLPPPGRDLDLRRRERTAQGTRGPAMVLKLESSLHSQRKKRCSSSSPDLLRLIVIKIRSRCKAGHLRSILRPLICFVRLQAAHLGFPFWQRLLVLLQRNPLCQRLVLRWNPLCQRLVLQ